MLGDSEKTMRNDGRFRKRNGKYDFSGEIKDLKEKTFKKIS
jgi:hypothetical protein